MHRIRTRAVVALTVLAALLVGANVAEAQFYGFFGKNPKIRYRNFDWKIYHSTHFDVYYYEDEAAQLDRVVSFAESAYDYLSREFDHQIKQPTPLIFYRTHAEFQQTNIISNYIPEGTGAFASPVRNRMVMPIDLPDDEFMELMLHELTHIFQYHVLYGGSTGRGLTQVAPQYINEGMASYFAQDESARDKMYLRDAVVNDSLPPITAEFQGYFAYRYGHAFFDFIEERWGKEGVREFLIELRNTLGARVGPAVERTFFMSAEDFNADFRRWLRKKYLPELVATGEPGDFGRAFSVKQRRRMWLASPAASPSGDLVAALMQDGRDTDVVLLDAQSRELLKNLTKGYTSDYQYLIAQEVGQLGRKMGRDLSFSPDGNSLAVFSRHEGERELLLIDVLKGKIQRRIPISVDQPLAPAFHPDGSKVIFGGHRGGQFDIFEVVLATGEILQVTEDAIFDGAPVYSPDGKSVVFVSTIGDFDKLFRIERDNPAERYQLTHGESDENDPIYSPDGSKIYFTSDRTGANNIFSLEPETGEIVQYTNAVTGCFMPTVLANPAGSDSIVYTAFWKGAHDIYRMDLGDPITEPVVLETREAAATPRSLSAQDLPRFEPAIEVAIDDANVERYGGKKFFVENFFGGTIGISDDQTFLAAIGVSFTDYLGDRRILAYFQSVESFRNFDVRYINQAKRLQRMYRVWDEEDFYVFLEENLSVNRISVFKETGASASLIYPVDFNHRIEIGVGYARRELDFLVQIGLPLEDAVAAGELDELIRSLGLEELTPEEQVAALRPLVGDVVSVPVIEPRTDDYPFVSASFVGDSTVYGYYGPHTGQRYRLSASYAPNTDSGPEDGSTLYSSFNLDYRGYIPLSRRSEIAFRGYGYTTSGDFATPVYFGGLDTIRGVPFRSIVGDEGFFTNIELRFPLLDQISIGNFGFQGIRGFVFLDVGGARFGDLQPNWECWDSDSNSLGDCVSSYGFGFTVNMFGLPLNWNFSKLWDFDKTLSDGFDTSFWIGYKF